MNPTASTAKIRFTALLIVAVIVFSACTKLCRSGYEGNNCNVQSRIKFTGTWSAIDTPGNLIYTDTISEGTGFSGVIISKNFAGSFFSHPIYASADGPNLNISAQKPDSNQFVLQGTGTIGGNDSIISWTCQITNTLDSPNVTTSYGGTWTK